MKPIVFLFFNGIPWWKSDAVPYLPRLWKKYPHTFLSCSGESLGYPKGVPSSREKNLAIMGAGRPFPNPYYRVNRAIRQETLFHNMELQLTMEHAKSCHTKLHFLCLLSKTGTEADLRHLHALLDMAKMKDNYKVFVHAILDDSVSLAESLTYLRQLEKKMKRFLTGNVADIACRVHAMNQTEEYHLTEIYYRALTEPPSRVIQDYETYLKEHPAPFCPIILSEESRIEENDAIVVVNLEKEGVRQIVRALSDPTFSYFKVRSFFNIRLTTWFPFPPSYLTTSAFSYEIPYLPLLSYLEREGYPVYLSFEEHDKETFLYYFDQQKNPMKQEVSYQLEVTPVSEMLGRWKTRKDHVAFSMFVVSSAAMPHSAFGLWFETLYQIMKQDHSILIVSSSEPICDDTQEERIPFLICETGHALRQGTIADITATIFALFHLRRPPLMLGKSLFR